MLYVPCMPNHYWVDDNTSHYDWFIALKWNFHKNEFSITFVVWVPFFTDVGPDQPTHLHNHPSCPFAASSFIFENLSHLYDSVILVYRLHPFKKVPFWEPPIHHFYHFNSRIFFWKNSIACSAAVFTWIASEFVALHPWHPLTCRSLTSTQNKEFLFCRSFHYLWVCFLIFHFLFFPYLYSLSLIFRLYSVSLIFRLYSGAISFF